MSVKNDFLKSPRSDAPQNEKPERKRSVYEKENPDNGTITDMNGNYSISLEDPESTVVFKYIGFITKQEAVAKRVKVVGCG